MTAASMVQLLTVAELAELLRVTPATIYGLRYRGDAPPAVRIGRELRFDPAAVHAWLAGRTT